MRKENKTNAFCPSVTLEILAATLCFFKITQLFSFVKAKENPRVFIKFFRMSGQLWKRLMFDVSIVSIVVNTKLPDVKQGLHVKLN